jgi:hypothetical protein
VNAAVDRTGEPLRPSAFTVPSEARSNYTHRLFRYPAKFHPPVADALIAEHSDVGDTIYDPFCGSGTLLVEASVLGRSSIGSDIDPLAVLVASGKTRLYDLDELNHVSSNLLKVLQSMERPESEYEHRKFSDLTDSEFDSQSKDLWIPEIPNINHWFRRYVQVDLARIWDVIAHGSTCYSEQSFEVAATPIPSPFPDWRSLRT